MFFFIGFAIVFGSIYAGYSPHGDLAVLWQPLEFIIILGGAFGALIIANPKPVLGAIARTIGRVLKSPPHNKGSYLELLTLLYSIFRLAKSKGMRIQIVDQEGGSLFESGSAIMTARTKLLLSQIAQVVSRLPNEISISGHTDSTPFHRGDYSNWELSTDRANASRRALVAAGVDPSRVVKVTGRADQDPLIAEDPSLPQNRRISIVLLRGSTVLPPSLAQ